MNLDTPICDLDGKPFQDGSTVKSAILQALVSALPGDEKEGRENKLSMFGLQLKVHAASNETAFTAEEIAMIKDRVSRGYPALVMGRVFEVLDPAELKGA